MRRYGKRNRLEISKLKKIITRTYSSVVDYSIGMADLDREEKTMNKKYSYWPIIDVFFSLNVKNTKPFFLFCSYRVKCLKKPL
jgi:hypothetical protein